MLSETPDSRLFADREKCGEDDRVKLMRLKVIQGTDLTANHTRCERSVKKSEHNQHSSSELALINRTLVR